MEIRLQKFLAKAGIASRRKSEELISNGKVKVNGLIVTELGTTINPETDIVKYNDKKVILEEEKVYFMLHKPTGYVTTAKDEKGRKTVLDLMKGVSQRIYPVGRLDYDTSGLLLLTNDGDLTYKITHPKHEVEKIYVAKVKGVPTPNELDQFQKGLIIDGRKTSRAKINIINTNRTNSVVSITIKEGRNRQVRKMCEAISHPVLELKRIAIGKLSIDNLEVSKYRSLTKEEIRYLQNL